ncbi:MAG: LysM peptidoglycan-binding domain-containing protein [Terrimicrobiaceae bacterium]
MNATISPGSFRELAKSLVKNPPKPGVDGETLPEPDDFPEEAAATQDAEEDFEEEAERGLSFSKAFLIVLGLHLLVIGGFYAFGATKSLRGPQYAGVIPTKETIQRDKKWLAEHPPISKPAAKAALTASVEPKKMAKKGNAATSQRVATKRSTTESKPTAVVAQRKPAATKDAVTEKRAVVLAPTTSPTNDDPPWMEKAKSMLAANTPPPVPAESPIEPKVETRRAVPVVNEAPAAAAPSAPSEVSLPGEEYTLASGDSLYAVSRKVHVSYQEIAEANGIKDPRQLQVGQKLKIPSSKVTSL